MANNGSFTKTANGFTGTIRTLALSVKANIVPDEYKASEAAPDYRVFSGTVELGAGWKRTAKNGEQRGYVSVKLDDPSFPAAIYANLVQTEGDEAVRSEGHTPDLQSLLRTASAVIRWKIQKAH